MVPTSDGMREVPTQGKTLREDAYDPTVLDGTVQMLMDLLAIVNPPAYTRSHRIRRIVGELVEELEIARSQELRVAAMLSMIGCVAISEEIVGRRIAGQPLDAEEEELIDAHPEVARQLLRRIPSLKRVAEIVGGQIRARQNPTALDRDYEYEIQLLAAASQFDALLARGESRSSAFKAVRDSGLLRDRALSALGRVRTGTRASVTKAMVWELQPSMVLTDDVRTIDGSLLLAKGNTLSDETIVRLRGYSNRGVLAEPLQVRKAAEELPALLRVLVVEDSRVQQVLAVNMLEALDCDVDVAANGQEALDLLSDQTYAVVFMDCQMPVMDGFEATRRIRLQETSSGEHVLIVALTAMTEEGIRERCLQAGMDDYLSKPIQPEELKRVVVREREIGLETSSGSEDGKAPVQP